MTALLNKLFVFIVLMVVGYVCAKRELITPDFTRCASRLVVNIFTCATIINSVFNTDLGALRINLGEGLLVITLSTLMGYVVSAVFVRFIKAEGKNRALYEILMAVPNTMFIGLPVLDAIYGAEAVLYSALSCIPFNLTLYSYGVYRLKSGQHVKLTLKEVISPPLAATIAALAVMFIAPPIPVAVKELVSAMAAVTMPLSMLVIGSSLGSVSLLHSFTNPKMYFSTFVRLLASPLAAWAVCAPLTSNPVLLHSAVVLAACPTGTLVSVLGMRYGHDGVLASEGVLHSTVLSMLTIPLVVWLLI